MEKKFWLKKWDEPQQGFDQELTNPHLQQFFPQDLPHDSVIFVPLCGKSVDMLWLMQQGHKVVGVEFSEKACRAFFARAGLSYEIQNSGPFKIFHHPRIKIYCGDFFDLTTKQLQDIAFIYDRAALIALPPKLRKKYTKHLQAHLSGVSGLLITFEYDPLSGIFGPPFAVFSDEVKESFTKNHSLHRELLTKDRIPPRFEHLTVHMAVFQIKI